MLAIIGKFRNEQPKTIGGVAVNRVQDFSTATETSADGQQKTLPQPKSNVLKYWLADGSWVAVRPSGTEPKLKFYIGVESDSQEASQLKIDTIADDLMNFAK